MEQDEVETVDSGTRGVDSHTLIDSNLQERDLQIPNAKTTEDSDFTQNMVFGFEKVNVKEKADTNPITPKQEANELDQVPIVEHLTTSTDAHTKSVDEIKEEPLIIEPLIHVILLEFNNFRRTKDLQWEKMNLF